MNIIVVCMYVLDLFCNMQSEQLSQRFDKKRYL